MQDVACLQARLSYYNINENWLTRQFTIEYASLFDVILPALARWQLPLPLGGTSNHFRIDPLKQAGGWDAWNVTEDADLGLRLARLGYRAEVLGSTTFEEANCRLGQLAATAGALAERMDADLDRDHAPVQWRHGARWERQAS
jgi:cellulose synthase/poly-beta-1,6-N-acetylglucosamine synthase-like glycosyltransferase